LKIGNAFNIMSKPKTKLNKLKQTM